MSNKSYKSDVKKGREAVIVAGGRTPFVRSFGDFMKIDSIGLGTHAVKGLLEKTELPYKEVDGLIWGGVVLPNGTPNIGREIALDVGLPPTLEAFTVSRACTTSMLSITLAAAAIERGEADVIIAGGGDSISNAEVSLPRKLMQTVAPVAMNRKAGLADWIGVAAQLAPFNEVLPQRPSVRERSTGQLMGEAAEDMARRNGITRKAQDEFTADSHHKAAQAVSTGRFSSEVLPIINGSKHYISDNIIRGDSTVEKLAKLRPVFAKDGTLTAGNSSALTDGAACVMIMSREKAEALGYTPLAKFRSWNYVGVDPADQLLIGPAISMPFAAEAAGMTLNDFDLFDIHEAFAGQVLSVTKSLGSDVFAKERYNAAKAFGDIPTDKLNVHGGSVSIGHPFAATGARMILTMANELKVSGKGTALLGACAAGGLGTALVMEAA